MLAQSDASPFDAADLVPELGQQRLPVHVVSLDDLVELATRFDTVPAQPEP